jgi:methionyl-tRNA synthetase
MPYFITTAIAYVNGPPHLGHAYEEIATDVLARHMRQRGEDVFFLTGTDEHGESVADSAHALGLEPKQWADQNAAQFKALMPILNISNDFFMRTTDPEHIARVQEVMQRIYDNGYVYKGVYDGWYCPRCADFKTDSDVGEGNTCLIHGIPLTRESEENWFFKLSAFQEKLEKLFAENRDFVMPARAMNEAEAFLASGLQDVSLSRSKLKWGVTVPWDQNHVFYVWFDALLNYYTALGYARPGEDLLDDYWPPRMQVIGKDILKFHTIFWPAMLMAAGIAPPSHVFVHGFLMGEDGRKMSKSLGNGLDPFEVIEQFGTDALRYYLLREVQFGQDGNVGINGCTVRYESELANEYGNLASRTIAMIIRYRDGAVPAVATDPALTEEFRRLPEDVAAHFDRADSTQALELIWQRVRRLNRYAEERQPWQLAKDPVNFAQLDQVLASLYEGLRVVSVLLEPYIPHSVEKLLAALGAPQSSYAAASFSAAGPLARGLTVTSLPPLFPKMASDRT